MGLLQRGVALSDALVRVYEPDATIDWANRTLMQLGNLRMGFTSRLANPQLTAGQTLAVMGNIDRHIDSHWADYQELPRPDAAKRAQVLALHETLTALMNEMADLHNALFVDNQSRKE
ncbi:MAG: hypothetical protein EOO63_10135 [Hymenobacter sp.]|nr:MAG: hypothetical protein EOO63_10135 [Hymenobacter sp.]